jgi:predicted nucleotidyltransferase
MAMNYSVLEAEGYDFELAGAQLIGRDAAGVISEDTRKRARETLESDPRMEELTNQIVVSSARNNPEHVRKCELLVSRFRDAFLEAS